VLSLALSSDSGEEDEWFEAVGEDEEEGELKADEEVLPSRDGADGNGLGECGEAVEGSEWGTRLRVRVLERPNGDIREVWEVPLEMDMKRLWEVREEECAAAPSTSIRSRAHAGKEEGRVLRSRWSSDTIGSLKGEGKGRDKGKEGKGGGMSPGKKLKSYFGGSGKRVSGAPASPVSPVSVSGRSVEETGVGRRGSGRSVRSSGSEASGASGSGEGGGRRRKPIPVEMFLRGAV
jgi:hypothetical protein